MPDNVERLLTLDEAAEMMHLSVADLKRLIEAGAVPAVKLPGRADDYAVTESQARSIVLKEQFDHLHGRAITVTQAAKDYDIPRNTILEWVNKQYITVIKPGYRMQIDQGDAAYCAAVYHAKGGRPGMVLFDEDGSPYRLKWPKLSERRRKK